MIVRETGTQTKMGSVALFLFAVFIAGRIEPATTQGCLDGPGEDEAVHYISATLETPGYIFPDGYPEMKIRTAETWNIYIPEADVIQFTLLHMDIQGCCSVFTVCNMTMTDQDTQETIVKMYSYGSEEQIVANQMVTSNSNNVTIRYAPNGSYFGAGFYIYFIGVRPDNVVQCGDTVQVTTNITEQRTFTATESYLNCHVLLKAFKQRIFLQVIFIDIDPSPHCMNQELALFKNKNVKSRLLGRMCRSRHDPQVFTLISESKDLLLSLITEPHRKSLIFNYRLFNPAEEDENQCEISYDFKRSFKYLKMHIYESKQIVFRESLDNEMRSKNSVYWIIEKLVTDDILLLLFRGVKLLWDPMCKQERITVRRGSCLNTSPLISSFCGTTSERYSQVYGMWTIIQFESYNNFHDAYFSMTYRYVAGPNAVTVEESDLILGMDEGGFLFSVSFFCLIIFIVVAYFVRRHYKSRVKVEVAAPEETNLYGEGRKDAHGKLGVKTNQVDSVDEEVKSA